MLEIAGKDVLCCSLTTLRLALRLWNGDPFSGKLLEFCEDAEEVRESPGPKAELGGSGEGSRLSRRIS